MLPARCGRRLAGSARDGLNDSAMPRPWQPALVRLVWAQASTPFRTESFEEKLLATREAAFCSLIGGCDGESPAVRLFQRLRRDGLSWSATGLDFTGMLHYRHPEAPSAVLNGSQVLQAMQLFWRGMEASEAAWVRALWEADAVARSTVCALDRSPPRGLRALLAHGFLRVRDWGLDLAALRAQVAAALEKSAWGIARAFRTSKTHLPALEPLLRNTSLARLIRGYLGSARFDGFATFSLLPNATDDSYPSGLWHHDRCGRRLRLFVFVHDVREGDVPVTQVARGTHNTVHLNVVEHFPYTRFSDAYVRSRERAAPHLALPASHRCPGP